MDNKSVNGGKILSLKEIGRRAQYIKTRGLDEDEDEDEDEDSQIPAEIKEFLRKLFQKPAVLIVESFDLQGNSTEKVLPLYLG